MKVKRHGKLSSERDLNGGGPQGGTFGIWEYLSQTNDNLNFVDENLRFKFVDDASVIEVLNLMSIGMASYNFKNHVASNIPKHDRFVPAEYLKSQEYIEELDKWSQSKLMEMNLDKTKVMIFNFSRGKKFTVSLKLHGKEIEVGQETKLL